MTVPVMFRYARYGGVFGKGIGFTAGLGVQFSNTEFHKFRGSDALPVPKPFFRTYVAEVGVQMVLGGNYVKSGITRLGMFTRAGWCPEGDALSVETGLRYTIDVPFNANSEYILYKPISLTLPGDVWPAIGY